MSRRLKLHNALCDILSCPNKGPECRAYFQPPSSVKMKYPAIVYALDDIENTFANDGVYLSARKYSVTVIDSDPDSSLVGKVASMPTSRFNRHYMKKKLVWDKTGERLYETGVSQGVFYPIQTGGVYNSGTAWNGLSTVTGARLEQNLLQFMQTTSSI